MNGVPSTRVRLLMGVCLGVVSVVFANRPGAAFVFFLLLYGLWNLILLFIVPRSRFTGGIFVLFVSMPALGIATRTNWIAPVGGLLVAHGSWLAFISAARLDE